MDVCKKNCRNNSKETYARHYKRVKEDLGWRKLNKSYFSNADGKYVFELHPAKTSKGLRDIPLTARAIVALRQQYFVKQTIINKGKMPLEGFADLVFVNKNNRPTTQFLVSECIECTVKPKSQK